jgi:hypothetical protein
MLSCSSLVCCWLKVVVAVRLLLLVVMMWVKYYALCPDHGSVDSGFVKPGSPVQIVRSLIGKDSMKH